jgi:hypothetical protein
VPLFHIRLALINNRGGVDQRMEDSFIATDVTDEDLLKSAFGLYSMVADEVFAAMQKVKTGQIGETKVVAQAVKDLRDAFKILMDERTRVDKLRKQFAGVVGSAELDLDAARDEIGRRLARLRDAGGGV